jgi:signal transduction histidine kinase/CheY-like chemotaxis protein
MTLVLIAAVIVGMIWLARKIATRRAKPSKLFRDMDGMAREIKVLMQQIAERGDYSVRVYNPDLTRCWETKKCGQTECPSYGRLGNLRCWEVSGTFCRGEVQGVFAKKLGDCRKCGVYQAARRDSVFDLAESFNEMILMIGDRHQSLDAMNQRLAAEIKRADSLARQAQEGTEAKSEFLANMSHEIRTPITAILGNADLMLDENLGLATQEYVAVIKRNGEHLLGLINDILDLSKVEAGKLSIEPTRCSPVQLAADVVSLMHVRAEVKQLRLETNFVGPLPETVFTDPLRLRQVLVNLVGNAIKFTDQGEVRLTVRLASDGNSTRLCFDVTDTGIGMKEEQIAKLFQPFSQVDASAARRFSGTGLGLCISNRLVEAMGGNIEVCSVPGCGSTFTVTIGLGPLGDTQMVQNIRETLLDCPLSAPTATPEKTVLHGRILLAEDGIDNQRLLLLMLRKAGADVTAVENGQRAVTAALTASGLGEPFDLILMDMQMPVVDGYEATRQLRKLGCTTAIVALTAYAMAEDCQKCLDAGCDGYLAKPIDRQNLLNTVVSWLARSSQVVS